MAAMERTATPGIYKRGGSYVVVWRHRGVQHKSFHRTLAEAREAKGRRTGGGGTAPVTRATFEDYATAWVAGYAGRTSRGFTEQARRDYARSMAHAVAFFAGWRLADVTAPDVRRYVAHLEGTGLAPSSVVKNVAPLRAMLATAVEDGELRVNPAVGVRVNRRRPDGEDGEQVAKALTRAQLAELLDELPDDWRLFFALLAETGLRISEALGLDVGDVEQGATPTLHVRRQCYRGTVRALKSRAGRRDLPLSPALARGLWVARGAAGDGPLFATAAGTRYSDRNVRRVLDRATARVGLGWVGFHTLRHTCASVLLDDGRSIRQVAEWLGHTDPAFTLRTYVHLMDGGLGGPNAIMAALPVGNTWATQHPRTAANERVAVTAETHG